MNLSKQETFFFYIWTFEILVLTWGKSLEALGSRIGTGLVFCHSFSFSNNVQRNFPVKQIIGTMVRTYLLTYLVCTCNNIRRKVGSQLSNDRTKGHTLDTMYPVDRYT